MREKLIELIRKADKEDYTSATQDQHYEFMADNLIANGATIQRWIPVSERLPDLELVEVKTDDKDLFPCLVVRKHPRAKAGKFTAKVWYDGYGFIDGNSIDVTDEITHWMPLPQPPKEGE